MWSRWVRQEGGSKEQMGETGESWCKVVDRREVVWWC